MKSLDTNVLARMLLRDDDSQLKLAEQLLRDECLALSGVFIELVWVLESRGWERRQIVQGLEALVALETLSCDRDAVSWSIGAYAQGADFADMLHLALSRDTDAFVTFDKGVARFADDTQVPVETLR